MHDPEWTRRIWEGDELLPFDEGSRLVLTCIGPMEERIMGELLTGRVAVVTGAGRGIGRGIAVELAREGAKVMVASRSQGSIDATLGEIAPAGGEAMGRVCDVGDARKIAASVARTERKSDGEGKGGEYSVEV